MLSEEGTARRQGKERRKHNTVASFRGIELDDKHLHAVCMFLISIKNIIFLDIHKPVVLTFALFCQLGSIIMIALLHDSLFCASFGTIWCSFALCPFISVWDFLGEFFLLHCYYLLGCILIDTSYHMTIPRKVLLKV